MVHLFRQVACDRSSTDRGGTGAGGWCGHAISLESRRTSLAARPCGPSQRAKARRQRGERSSPDPGDSRAAEGL